MKVCPEMTNVSPWAEYLQLDRSLYLVLGAEGGPGEVGQEVGGQKRPELVPNDIP